MEPDLRSRGARDKKKVEDGPRPSFLKAVGVTIAIYGSTLLVVWIPIINVLVLTFIPYVASAIGTRYTVKRERIPASLTASIIWSTLETSALLFIFGSLIETPMGFTMGSLEYLIVASIWMMNLVFSTLGAINPWMDPFKDYSRV